MRLIVIGAALSAVVLSSGCQNFFKTMVAHTTLNSRGAFAIASANAFVNTCMAEGKIDRAKAYDFSLAAASFLDFVVFDNKFYAQTYNEQLDNARTASTQYSFSQECAKLEGELPRITQDILNSHAQSSYRVSEMRAQENQQMLQMLGSARAPSFTPPVPSQLPSQISFGREDQKTQTYLVNTGKGLRQCRVTNNSFVFCM